MQGDGRIYERVELAFALGERDLELFMAANGLPRDEALAQIERSRQAGRRYSRCAQMLWKRLLKDLTPPSP